MDPDRRPVLWVHVLLCAVGAAVALRAFLLPVAPNDFWWALATGRLIAETGSIPTADVFSYTFPGALWLDQPWLSQVFMFQVHALGGVPLVQVSVLACLAITFALLYRLGARMTRAPRATAALLLLTLPASSPGWSVRSQAFALPLFIAFVVVLYHWRARGAGARLWLLPVLMAVWVNVHGSFVLGGVLVAVTLVGTWAHQLLGREGQEVPASIRALVLWGSVTALAVLLNPRGAGVLAYVTGVVGNSAIQDLIREWQRPSPFSFIGGAFFLYAGALVWAVVSSRRRLHPAEALVAVAFFWLGVSAVRHTPWFVLATTPLFLASAVETRLGAWVETWREPSPRLARALVGAIGVVVMAATPWIKPSLPWPAVVRPVLSTETPVAAVAALQADPQGPRRLFHSEGFGSYLLWAAPERRVFIDTRVEVYPADHWESYVELSAGGRAAELLDSWRVDGLLLDRRYQWGLVEWVRANPDWVVRFEDAGAVYFVKSPGT